MTILTALLACGAPNPTIAAGSYPSWSSRTAPTCTAPSPAATPFRLTEDMAVEEIVLLADGRASRVGPARWLHSQHPDDAALRRLLVGDQPEMPCFEARLEPLATPGRYWVGTAAWVSVVDVTRGWVRHMDPTSSDLEGCELSRGRTSVSCHLDLQFGPPARFDEAGASLDGRFEPHWTR